MPKFCTAWPAARGSASARCAGPSREKSSAETGLLFRDLRRSGLSSRPGADRHRTACRRRHDRAALRPERERGQAEDGHGSSRLERRLVEMAVLTHAGSRLSYEMTLRRKPPWWPPGQGSLSVTSEFVRRVQVVARCASGLSSPGRCPHSCRTSAGPSRSRLGVAPVKGPYLLEADQAAELAEVVECGAAGGCPVRLDIAVDGFESCAGGQKAGRRKDSN